LHKFDNHFGVKWVVNLKENYELEVAKLGSSDKKSSYIKLDRDQIRD
jgi:hypothetical protein